MNKTTKGSLAAGAAAVLLLGGAGSLAFWTDNAIVDGGEINSGFLTLDAVPFSADQDCTDIVYADDAANIQDVPAVVNVVPGDVVTTTCTFEIRAEGDNLEATPTIPDSLLLGSTPETDEGPAGGTGQLFADVSVDYQLDQDGTLVDYTGAPITEDNDSDLLVATITMDIAYGTGDFLPNGEENPVAGGPNDNRNDTQNITAALDQLSVTLSQVDPNA